MRSPIFVAVSLLLLAACQSQPSSVPPSMSVEEAKTLTADFPNTGFVPPPRTIADITAILEHTRPDASALAARRAITDAPTPSDATAQFYFERGQVLRYEGRMIEAIADISEAVRLSPHEGAYLLRLGEVLSQGGYPVDARKILAKAAVGNMRTIVTTLLLSDVNASLGDDVQSERDLNSARGLYAGPNVTLQWQIIRSAIEAQQGRLFMNRGNYAAAENAFRSSMADADLAVMNWHPSLERVTQFGVRANWKSGGLQKEASIETSIAMKRQIADLYRQRGTLDEAEYWIRSSLTQSIEKLGVTAPSTIAALRSMSLILADQGRYIESQKIAEMALAKVRIDNPRTGSTVIAEILGAIGAAAIAQTHVQEAMGAFQAESAELAALPALRNRLLGTNLDYAIALRGAGRIDEGLHIAQAAADWRTRTLGPASSLTVLARGFLASFLAAAGDHERALAEFQAVVPQLMSLSQTSSAAGAIDTSRKAQFLLDDYIRLLATMRGFVLEQRIPGGVTGEAFRVADLARGGTVQQALIESGARAAITDKALADLARREQDTSYQIAARERVLADAQSLATSQQDSQALERLHAEVEQLRIARTTLRAEIERRFPSYARITEPQPPSLVETRAVLGADEALVSLYVGEKESYVWAVPKVGNVAFANVPLGREQLTTQVTRLREALDPQATRLGDIPPFDVALAHQLYASILAPVEGGWKGAKKLIVVPSGPMAQLPFALLVTRPITQPTNATDALFSGYKDVPFLVRDVAVSQVPSVAALVTLRKLPAGNPTRQAFVGFGDPWFSAAQAAQARAEQTETAMVDTRSFRLRAAPATETFSSATLAMLPRLPDTAVEVREVAATLKANPATDVYLGAAANERQVLTMKLDDRRVVLFATHGLVPGDLDGLAQPALALTAPGVAGVDGDGLLTMEKILGLKLDADWVVLSACNTAAGQGAGAEAVSGLGRAFFYAGARTLLVTHWPVESTSARLLTTMTFRRQAADLTLTRAEALRRSMLDLIDSPGYLDPGTKRVAYSYAHPIFWAPFALVGDGR